MKVIEKRRTKKKVFKNLEWRKFMGKFILTKKEDKMTRYCENFCPIYRAITDYNNSHAHIIFCSSDMCTNITRAYALNEREKEVKNEKSC